MCLGLPMRVLASDGMTAKVERGGEVRDVTLILIGDQPAGTPLLVHCDTALRVLDEDEVPMLEAALATLEAARRGEPFEAFLDVVAADVRAQKHGP